MRADKVLAAEEVVVVASIATGDLLAQGSNRTLPNPRRIVAAFILYGILSLLASLGRGPARFAAASGAVIMLAALVLGPGGAAVVQLLQRAGGLAQTPAGSQPQAPAGTTAATGAPKPSESAITKILNGLQSILQFDPNLIP